MFSQSLSLFMPRMLTCLSSLQAGVYEYEQEENGEDEEDEEDSGDQEPLSCVINFVFSTSKHMAVK